MKSMLSVLALPSYSYTCTSHTVVLIQVHKIHAGNKRADGEIGVINPIIANHGCLLDVIMTSPTWGPHTLGAPESVTFSPHLRRPCFPRTTHRPMFLLPR